MTMNNLRDGLVWYASEKLKNPEELAKQLANMPDAAVRRALVKIAADTPGFLDILKREAEEKDEFSCSEQPDPLRMPNPWATSGRVITSSAGSLPKEIVWWPIYDVQTVQYGDVSFFQNPGKEYNESNHYIPGCLESDNQFALYEVELRFKNILSDNKNRAVFRLSIGDKMYMIVPLDNMYMKTTVPNTYAIGTVVPIYFPPRTPFNVRVSFLGPLDPSVPSNAVRCILNGYRMRDVM